MSRNIRGVLEDLSRLHDELQVRGEASVVELAERLNVPRKRIYDYFEYLKAFLGEDCIEGTGGRYALTLAAPRSVRVGEDERRVLALAHSLLAQIGLPFGAAFDRLFERLAGDPGRGQAERERVQAQVRRLVAFSEPHLCRPPGDGLILDQLFVACSRPEARKIRFRYDSLTSPEQTERCVWPLGLVFQQAWYMVGHDPTKAPALRVYAVDRMQGVKEESFGAPYPGQFDVQSHMATAWRLIVGDGMPRRVVLRMPERLAKTHKHESQRVESEGEDGCVVTFMVAEPLEMVGFVMSHVHELTVLEPIELRQAVTARLRAGLKRHDVGA